MNVRRRRYMIRVLHVMANLNVDSGMVNVVVNFHRKLDRSKIQFDYLYYEVKENNRIEEIESLGGKTWLMRRPAPTPKFFREMNAFFREHTEYHIIHCHPAWAPFFYGWASRHTQIHTIIAHSHSSLNGESLISRVRNSTLRVLAIPVVTDYFACSENAARAFPLINKKRVRILNNAIDTKCFAFRPKVRTAVRESLGITSSEILIGHIGRFEEPKNHSFLIRVFEEYHKRNPNAKLLLVGRGSLRNAIRSQIAAASLNDAVILLDETSHVERLYAAMDLFLFPSLYEGLPLVLLEAQASGLHCLVSDAVPKEARITARCTVCPLSASAGKWASAMGNLLEGLSLDEREKFDLHEFRNKGMELSTEADRLTKIYAKMS